MRELKFRIRIGSQLIGYEILDEQNTWKIELEEGLTTDDLFEERSELKRDQYVGLKDSQGREIYERDLIRVEILDYSAYTATVAFDNGAFIDSKYQNQLRNLNTNHDACVEVIGGPYKSPELVS